MKLSPLTLGSTAVLLTSLACALLCLGYGLTGQWFPSVVALPALPYISSADYAPLVGMFLMVAVAAGGWVAVSSPAKD